VGYERPSAIDFDGKNVRELPVISEKELRRALKQYFGFSKFRPNQKEVVQALLEGKDAFVSMPTGGGKSLCYQLAGLLMEGLTVVVSPLIALMQDQVGAARELGLAAAFLNSSMKEQEIRAVYRRLHAGQIKLLYISPERFASSKFRTRLQEFEPGLCVIDEAHCISEWGHDFRPDYLELSRIRSEFPGSRIAAFTATATKTVQNDILKKLKMKDPFVVRASFDRPELFYRVMPKESVLDQILAFVQDRPGKSGIVYRSKRADVEATSEFLSKNGVNARPYHAGLPDETRRRHQERFVRDETDVIVATIAFGMGIDKSNVRFVVHGDLPKSLEAYYQETGRAGRDGLLSHCLLLHSPGDIRTQRYFIDQIEDAAEAARGRRNLETMLGYAQSSECRRTQLLNHFDEEHSGNCGRCDVCTDQASTEDLTVDAQKLLSAVARTGERFGAGHVVDIVKGSDTEKIRERGHDALPTFGVGRGRPKKHWQQIVADLLAHGALVQDGGRYPTLSMSPAGRDILFGRAPFQVLRRQQPAILLKRRGSAGRAEARAAAAGGTAREIETELFELLREKRLELSREKGIAPYMVFSDASLEEMAREIPRDRQSFLQINGVGRKKMKQYGAQFIEVIDNYARERGYVESRPNGQ
jgi:ATP-dependent DNA helicase RecQ